MSSNLKSGRIIASEFGRVLEAFKLTNPSDPLKKFTLRAEISTFLTIGVEQVVVGHVDRLICRPGSPEPLVTAHSNCSRHCLRGRNTGKNKFAVTDHVRPILEVLGRHGHAIGLCDFVVRRIFHNERARGRVGMSSERLQQSQGAENTYQNANGKTVRESESLCDAGDTGNNQSSGGGSHRNNLAKFFSNSSVSVTNHGNVLFLELFGKVSTRRARNVAPGLGEQHRHNHSEQREGDWSYQQVDWRNVLWRSRNEVQESTREIISGRGELVQLPLSNVFCEWSSVENSGDGKTNDVEVVQHGVSKHQWQSSTIKQLDWVHRSHGSNFGGLDWDVDSAVSKVDSHSQGCQRNVDLGQVCQVFSGKGLVDGQSKRLISDVSDELHQSTVRFPASGSDRGGYTNERGSELSSRPRSTQGQNTRTKPVALVEQFHQKSGDQSHERQLNNVGESSPNWHRLLGGKLVNRVKVAGKGEQDRVHHGNEHSGQLLPRLEQFSVGSGFKADFHNLQTSQYLPQETSSDNRQQTEFQGCTCLGSKRGT
ncbi:hypothetical protein OGAPHI_002362 [Ogataea philodendri]|uniref:Uncharacterized protein n=1 Tax=Ogataea philodendri TaxID=1378263 RepID=A0A9P8PAJ0_9ASCO|nr:uncharacterized protein OGAPHI_002362 [Ogataea philodendri]KAH3668608.1 hypothetical protein OGAPHI_002362 [Ogataea philodendri]